MKIEDALSGVTKIGVDTAPLIYYIERHPSYVAKMRAIIQRIDAGLMMAYCSVITLTELLTLPKRLGNKTLEEEYINMLTQGRNITLVPIDRIVAEQAAELRARFKLRTPDALQIAAIMIAGCQAFLTNDTTIKRVQELRVIVLKDMDL